MINMFRTVLLNMAPATANALPLVEGYMIVDDAYTFKALNSINQEIYNTLFADATTDAERIARATTIHNIIKHSMLSPILTKYDVRITGLSSYSEPSPDVIKTIMDKKNTLVIDSSSPIFVGTTDKELYAEHAFFRPEPVEQITGLAIAMVEDVIITRRLQWL